MIAWLSRSALLCELALVAAVAAAYANSLHVPFHFDDARSILNNRTLRQLPFVWPVLLYPPGNGATVQGRPVLNLSFAANYALGGIDVVGYHVTNVAVHAAAALTLFGLVRRTLALPGIPERYAARATGLAFAAALLWALHPLQTESVTYLVQRAESLAGLWYLLTFYCTVRANASSRRWAWHAAAAVACALGVMTKETVATAPILLAVFDRVYLSGSWRQAMRERGRLYAALGLTWVLLAALVWSSGSRGGSVGAADGITPWAYACTQFGFIVRYLSLTIWPADLVFDYGIVLARTPGEIVPPALAVAALLAATAVGLWRRPRLGFLGLAFFVLLAPTSTVLPINTQTGAEHRVYLALAPLVVLVVIAATAVALRFAPSSAGRSLAVVGVVIAVALGWRTHTRNEDYATGDRLWADVAAKWPRNYRGVAAASVSAANQGRYDEALGLSDEALRTCRAEGMSCAILLTQRAAILRQAGPAAECERAFADAVAEDQGGEALSARAQYYLDTNRPAAAADDLTVALARSPGNPELLANRGQALYLTGRFADARTDLDRAIDLDPYDPRGYMLRGSMNLLMARFRPAAMDFDDVLRLGGPNADAYLGRAQAAVMDQRVADATADIDAAARLDPERPQLHYLKGMAAWAGRDYAAAVGHLSEAVRRRPTFEVAYRLRAACHVALGNAAAARADVAEIKRLGGTPSPALLKSLSGLRE